MLRLDMSSLKKYQSTGLFLLGLLVVIFYILPYLLDMPNATIYAHDNLDSNFIYYKNLSASKQMLTPNSEIIKGIMNGLPRAVYPSELNVVSLLFLLFSSSTAYMLNAVFMHLIAFVGMYFFSREYLIDTNTILDELLVVGIAVCFAYLQFIPWSGLSLAGQPLLIYCMFNIKNAKKPLLSWAFIVIFAFYSSLILSGFFLLIYFAILFFVPLMQRKEFNVPLLKAIVGLSLLYLVAEYRLIMSVFDPLFVSHREEFQLNTWSIATSIENFKSMFLYGHYHANSFHSYFIFPFILLAAPIVVMGNKVSKYYLITITALGLITALYFGLAGDSITAFLKTELMDPYGFVLLGLFMVLAIVLFFMQRKPEASLMFSLVVIAIVYGLWRNEYFLQVKEFFPIIKQIQLDRFYFLNAIIWFALFALFAKMLINKHKVSIMLIILIIAGQITFSFKMKTEEKWKTPTTINQYYSPDFYKQIKEYIGKPATEYNVVSMGFDPYKAAYNGFQTLDGYFPNYPLKYKHQFRKIIEGELNKNETAKRNFDTWGSRCYMWRGSRLDKNKVIKNLAINVDQLKKMNCQYIFLKYLVSNSEQLNIKMVKEFINKQNGDILYLYEL